MFRRKRATSNPVRTPAGYARSAATCKHPGRSGRSGSSSSILMSMTQVNTIVACQYCAEHKRCARRQSGLRQESSLQCLPLFRRSGRGPPLTHHVSHSRRRPADEAHGAKGLGDIQRWESKARYGSEGQLWLYEREDFSLTFPSKRST